MAAVERQGAAPVRERRPLHPLARRAIAVAVLALGWEVGARLAANPLLFPTFSAAALAFADAVTRDGLLARAATSLVVLLKGYALGVALALVLAALAVASRFARDLLETATAMMNPLPAIALLPLAMLWLGLGEASLLLVLVHAVMWPVALATSSGFSGVSPTLRMVGRSWGLRSLPLTVLILLPAAFPAILAGLRIGWAFAWRTLIAAELVFGISSGQGGLGWFIFQARNELYVDKVFAGLAAVIVIGFAAEGLVFRTLEQATVRRWGMVGQAA
jgi:NitT/TauT family transport system permease protein